MGCPSAYIAADLFPPGAGQSYTPFTNPNSNFFLKRSTYPDSAAYWKAAYSGVSISNIQLSGGGQFPVTARVEVKPAIDSLAIRTAPDSTNWFVCPGGVTISGPLPERTLPLYVQVFADGQPVTGVNPSNLRMTRSVLADPDSLKFCPYPSGSGTPTYAWDALPDTTSALSDSTGLLLLNFTGWRAKGAGTFNADTTTAEDRNLTLTLVPGRAAGSWYGAHPARDTIDVRSPDVNADFRVNLIDFAIFGGAMNTTKYWIGDFDYDRDVDLIDFALWGAHSAPADQHRCE